MADICITEDGKVALFILPAGSSCPRVGETIRYLFEPTSEDRKNFSTTAIQELTSLLNCTFRVTSVEHVVRRTDWNKTYVTTWVGVVRKRSRG